MKELCLRIEDLSPRNNRQKLLDLLEGPLEEEENYSIHNLPSAILLRASPFSTLVPGLR
jgi:hypothetical protein